MVNCLLIGVPSWCRHLERELSSVSTIECRVAKPWQVDRLRGQQFDIAVRVGMRHGAPTARGRAFDLAWSRWVPETRRVTYWIGTDVYDTAHDVERHERDVGDIRGVHLAGAPWMAAELVRIGVPAETMLFPTAMDLTPPVPFPERFVVNVYVPELKPDFYGRRGVEELARRHPTIAFEVWGARYTSPVSNLVYRGRTDDLQRELDRAVLHVRLTRHDAFATTVREALARARYVLFPYDFAGVRTVAPWDIDAASRIIAELHEAFQDGRLPLNVAGRHAIEPVVGTENAAALADRLSKVAQAASR